MKILVTIILLFFSFSAFSQKKDSLEIKIIIAQNIRLRQTNEILNQKLHEYFLRNLELTKDSAINSERIINLIKYINENNCAGDSVRFKSYDEAVFSTFK
jgi:hypothetical protein